METADLDRYSQRTHRAGLRGVEQKHPFAGWKTWSGRFPGQLVLRSRFSRSPPPAGRRRHRPSGAVTPPAPTIPTSPGIRMPAGLLKGMRLWPWLAAVLSGFLCAACFSAVRSSLVLLDRAHSVDRGGLVFREKFQTPLAAKSPARLCGRNCFFHYGVQLVRLARDPVRKFVGSAVFRFSSPSIWPFILHSGSGS